MATTSFMSPAEYVKQLERQLFNEQEQHRIDVEAAVHIIDVYKAQVVALGNQIAELKDAGDPEQERTNK